MRIRLMMTVSAATALAGCRIRATLNRNVILSKDCYNTVANIGASVLEQEKKLPESKAVGLSQGEAFPLREAPAMQVKILERHALPGVPSASGVEVFGKRIFVVGDDSAFLYELDRSYQVVSKIPLLKDPSVSEGRIPKKVKPDFEVLLSLTVNGHPELLILGSGSRSPERDRGYRVALNPGRGETAVEVPLGRLYDVLRQHTEIVGNGKLNIEGGAATAKHVVLLQRKIESEENAAIYFEREAFISWLLDPATNRAVATSAPPSFEVVRYLLPKSAGVPFGFSGATDVSGMPYLLFSASAENTGDAEEDGAVLESAIGLLALPGSDAFAKMAPDAEGRYPIAALVNLATGGTDLPLKVESIAILSRLSDGYFRAIAVTDNDSGDSQLLVLEIQLLNRENLA